MKYFKENLSKEELRKEYKNLCRLYHPDISNDPNATRIFQDIQNEYNSYIPIDGKFTREENEAYKLDLDGFIEYLKKNDQNHLADLMSIISMLGGGYF